MWNKKVSLCSFISGVVPCADNPQMSVLRVRQLEERLEIIILLDFCMKICRKVFMYLYSPVRQLNGLCKKTM